MSPLSYFDVGPALTGGWRVIRVHSGDRIQVQVIMETAADVAAAAKLCDVAVLTTHAELRARCAALGVRLVDATRN